LTASVAVKLATSRRHAACVSQRLPPLSLCYAVVSGQSIKRRLITSALMFTGMCFASTLFLGDASNADMLDV